MNPESQILKETLQETKLDDDAKRISFKRGLICINRKYREQEASSDLYVTLIHEMIHANRNLLLFDVFRSNPDPKRGESNEYAYTFRNGKSEQNTRKLSSKHVDASQEILKGNIDTSEPTINAYNSLTDEEIDSIESESGKITDMMDKQYRVDEALVDLMAALSYKLHATKQKGENLDIWTAIEQARDTIESDDIVAMCEIILKHHDFELFKWMIDPISYSQGDIHYDFFGDYTKNDKDLLEKLYNDNSLYLINDEAIESIAWLPDSIEEIPDNIPDFIKNMMRTGDNGR